MSLRINSNLSAMFNMIVYVSAPYSLEHLFTQNTAITQLNRSLAGFYHRNPTWAAVNALYTVYNNPNIMEDSGQKVITYKTLFSTVSTLMRASQVHVVLAVPGWEYSDIVLSECACAAQFGIPTVRETVT